LLSFPEEKETTVAVVNPHHTPGPASAGMVARHGPECRPDILRNYGPPWAGIRRRVSSYQAKQHEEMQAVADALSLLANLVMAWNTMKMQSVLDRWNARRSTSVPPQLVGRIAPTRTEGINLRGVFSFPIEQYQPQLLPSLPAAKSRAFVG